MGLQRGEKTANSSSEHLWLCSHWGISLLLGLMDWENLGPGTIPHRAGFTVCLFIQELRATSPVVLPASPPWNHRIIEWFGLEGTLKLMWFQPPCHEQGHLPPAQVAQSSVQPGLEHCQGGGSHSFSG